MRFLLFNPNSNVALTGALAAALGSRLGAGDSVSSVTARTGPAFIGSPETIAAARGNLEEALPGASLEADAIVLGCFGDLDIAHLGEALGKPLVSLWDAGFESLQRAGNRTAILTTSTFWAEKIRQYAEQIAADQGTLVTVVEGASVVSTDALRDKLDGAVANLAGMPDVDQVVLGGALLESLRPSLRAPALPVVDLMDEAVKLCRRRHAGSGTSPDC